MINGQDHLKFFLHSGHCAEFPEGGGFPVLRDLWHCLQRLHPQFLQFMEDDDPQPDENLHISKVLLIKLFFLDYIMTLTHDYLHNDEEIILI